jgi:hypothetical protein
MDEGNQLARLSHVDTEGNLHELLGEERLERRSCSPAPHVGPR